MTGHNKVSSKPSSKLLKLDFFIPHQPLLALHGHPFSERLKNHFWHVLLHHGQYLSQPAGICHVPLEMPKEVTELGQNKPFVICQQEMSGGLIPVHSVMIALIMCAERREWIFWQDVRWSPLYKRLNFWFLYPYYLIQCDVYGMHKYLSMDSVWKKEKNVWEYGDFNH